MDSARVEGVGRELEMNMRLVFVPLLKIALLLTLFVASLAAISAMLPQPKPHNFANIDAASLWTVHPVKVDRDAQQFERLPPRNVQPQDIRQTAMSTSDDRRDPQGLNPVGDSFEAAGVDHTLVTGAITTSVDTAYDNAHVEWCHNRYKSYRVSDNSYQPYNGRRRQCQPPIIAGSDAGKRAPVGEETTAYGNEVHGQWCAARYRSYDASDNTYRAYSGQRRPCLSPYLW
jgi:hypothetical protein